MPEAHAVVPATITEDSARRHAIQALSNMGTVDEATVTMTGITESQPKSSQPSRGADHGRPQSRTRQCRSSSRNTG